MCESSCCVLRLTESPYKVVLEQLVGLQPPGGKSLAEDEEEEEEEERRAVLRRPLEICLKHSSVDIPDGSACPLVCPQAGVAALHEYAEWITELHEKNGDAGGETASTQAHSTCHMTWGLIYNTVHGQ